MRASISDLFLSKKPKFRFAFSLFANGCRSVFGFVTTLLLASTLGPVDYGLYVFLWGVFLSINSFSDLGTRRAFFYFISRREEPKKHFLFYISWVFIQLLVVAIIINIILSESFFSLVFVNAGKLLVILAIFAVYLRDYIWLIVTYIYEANRKTQVIQAASLFITIFNFFIILTLYKLSSLTLASVFIIFIVEYSIAIIFALYWANNKNVLGVDVEFNLKSTVSKYKSYCTPLLMLSIVTMIYGFSDRWMLQHYAGSTSQAYWGIASYFISGAMIFTTSMINVFWKEISEAKAKGDLIRIDSIYHKVSSIIFLFQVFIVGFICIWSREFFSLVLSKSYLDGCLAMSLILLYTPLQSLDLLLQALYCAVDEAKGLSVILSVFRILSIPITFFLLSHNSAFFTGLNLGAIGIGVKLLIMNIIYTVVASLNISRKGYVNFYWRFQVVVPILVFSIGLLSKIVLGNIHIYSIYKLIIAFIACLLSIGYIIVKFGNYIGIRYEAEMLRLLLKRA